MSRRIPNTFLSFMKAFSSRTVLNNERKFSARIWLQRLTTSFSCPQTLPLFVPAIPAVLSIAAVVKCKGSPTDADIIAQADVLYQSNEVDKLYELLIQSSDSTNADILWRLARATCDKAKSSKDNAEEKKKLMYEAFEVAQRALEAGRDKNFACHKWYAIMLDYIGEYQGTKERISKAYEIKEHFLKAIELNPKDATSTHLIGYWCFVFADLPWYQKKIAAVLFATPPSSTFDEALNYFLQAEKIDPNFYSMNLLMLGKTYLRLNQRDLAKSYLEHARDYPIRTEDDKTANKDATELLKSL